MMFSNVIEIETAVVSIVILGRISTSALEVEELKERNWKSKEVENFVFDILLPKSKLITVGVFYRPPNQAEFVDLMVENFSNLNLKDNRYISSRWFNINLFQNGKYIVNEEKYHLSRISP